MIVRILFLKVAIWLTMLILIGCAGSQPLPESPSNYVTVGNATDTINNLSVRVDKIQLKDTSGDFIGAGELQFLMLVIRENGDSRQYTAPGQGLYSVNKNSEIKLDGFSLTVNHIAPDEKILVYLMIVDEDKLGFFATAGANLAIEQFVNVTEVALRSSVQFSSLAGPAGFAVGFLSDAALDWWEQLDTIGEYFFVLEPANDWLRNKTHLAENDSTIVTFSIINHDKNSANVGKPSSLSDMLIERTDLPNGDWKVQRKNSESSDMPLSVLVEEGGLSFICKNQDERKNFAQSNILFDFAQIEWKTQDLPPQHLMEWILFADRVQDSEIIFEVIKQSLQSCENVTLVDEDDGNKIHHSFVPIFFPEYGNKTYAIKEDIKSEDGQQYLVVLYRGTSYSVLVQKENKVIFIYYMIGHSPLGHVHFKQINSIVESAIDKFHTSNEQ